MGACHSSLSRPSLAPFQSTPFPSYLTPAQLQTFSIYFRELSFPPSSVIFASGAEAGDFYLFLSGIAHIFTEQRFLCEKVAGDTINTTIVQSHYDCLNAATIETLLSSPLPRHSCSLHAVTPCKVLHLTHARMMEYIVNNPDTSQTLVPLLSCPFTSLTQLKFFASMSPRHLQTLSCYVLRMQALRSNETLFREGSLGSSVYILQSGQLKAVANIEGASAPSATATGSSGEDTAKLLHVFKDSDADDRIFGEIALIMDIPRTASIIALVPSIVLEWKRADYRTFLSLSSSQTAAIESMMKARTAEHFRKYKVPFFDSIPEEKYAILASLCKIEEIGPDEIIFREGERGTQFYLLAYGSVRVTCTKKRKTGAGANAGVSVSDEVLEICTMGPGKYFGEIALVQDTPRTATVTTITRCIILSISKENFQTFFHEAPEAIADFEIKLARYEVQLRSVLYHPLGLKFFTQHAQREYCEESIQFWLQCRDFRHQSLRALESGKETLRVQRRDARRKQRNEQQQQCESEEALPSDHERSSDNYDMLGPECVREHNAEAEAEFLDADFIDPEEVEAAYQFLELLRTTEQFAPLLASHVAALCHAFAADADAGVVAGPLPSTSAELSALSLPWVALRSFCALIEIYVGDDESFDELSTVLGLASRADSIPALHIYQLLISFPACRSKSTPLSVQYFVYLLARKLLELRLADLVLAFHSHARAKPGALNYAEFANLVRNELQLQCSTKLLQQHFNNGNTLSLTSDGAEGAGDTNGGEWELPLVYLQLSAPLSLHLQRPHGAPLALEALHRHSLPFATYLSFVLQHLHSLVSYSNYLFRTAQVIFDSFVSDSGARQVNIKGPTQKSIAAALFAFHKHRPTLLASNFAAYYHQLFRLTVHVFDGAEEEILNLLAADSFARFKQSELFQQFLNSAMAYTELQVSSGASDKHALDSSEPKAAVDSVGSPSVAHSSQMAAVGAEIRRGKTLRSGSIFTLQRQEALLIPPPPTAATTTAISGFSACSPRVPTTRLSPLTVVTKSIQHSATNSAELTSDATQAEPDTPDVGEIVRRFADTKLRAEEVKEQHDEPSGMTMAWTNTNIHIQILDDDETP